MDRSKNSAQSQVRRPPKLLLLLPVLLLLPPLRPLGVLLLLLLPLPSSPPMWTAILQMMIPYCNFCQIGILASTKMQDFVPFLFQRDLSPLVSSRESKQKEFSLQMLELLQQPVQMAQEAPSCDKNVNWSLPVSHYANARTAFVRESTKYSNNRLWQELLYPFWGEEKNEDLSNSATQSVCSCIKKRTGSFKLGPN